MDTSCVCLFVSSTVPAARTRALASTFPDGVTPCPPHPTYPCSFN